MLSNLFIKQLTDSLSRNSFINEEDFKIILPEKDTNPKIINIYYTYDESYYFKASLSHRLDFNCEFSPGKVMKTQKVLFSSEDDYFNGIEEWVERLEGEFTSTPLAKAVIHNQSEIEKLKDKVESYFKEKELDPDEQFSSEETQSLEEKLEEFKKSIEEKLKSEIAEKQSLKREVKNLFEEIEFLKVQMQKLTKKNWFTRFVTTTNKFIKNNPETTKAITQTAKHLLPEEIQNIIPEEATDIVEVFIEEKTKN